MAQTSGAVQITCEDGLYCLHGVCEGTPIRDEDFGKTVFDGMTKHPDREALIDVNLDLSISFKDLRQKAELISRHLLKIGCRRSDVIAFYAPSSIEYMIVYLAALRIGAVPASFNHEQKTGEVRTQLELCGAKFIFTDITRATTAMTAASSAKPNTVKNVIIENGAYPECLNLRQLLDKGNYCALPPLPALGHLGIIPSQEPAVLLFSSGTTGVQKPILLSHRNVQAELAVSIGKNVRKIQHKQVVYAAFAHLSGSFMTLFGLALGYTTYVMRSLDLDIYLRLISQNKVKTISVIPRVAVKLAKLPEVDNHDLSCLREIICGTAPLSKEIEDLLYKRFPNIRIKQAYGMTETSGMCTIIPGSSLDEPPTHDKPGSVGVPLPNVQIKFLDPDRKVFVGPNQNGELLIKSPLVMLGYGEVNGENNPPAVDSEGWLHSGDLGYFDEDGYIYIVDRLKEIIKYASQPVSPQEIERVLMSHPEVFDAGVFPVPHMEQGSLPAAWVVRQPGSEITERELESFVAGNLADYKHLRGGVEFADQIPRTHSGKILRKKMTRRTLGEQN